MTKPKRKTKRREKRPIRREKRKGRFQFCDVHITENGEVVNILIAHDTGRVVHLIGPCFMNPKLVRQLVDAVDEGRLPEAEAAALLKRAGAERLRVRRCSPSQARAAMGLPPAEGVSDEIRTAPKELVLDLAPPILTGADRLAGQIRKRRLLARLRRERQSS